MWFTPLLQGSAASSSNTITVELSTIININDVYELRAVLWQPSVAKYLSSTRTKILLVGIKFISVRSATRTKIFLSAAKTLKLVAGSRTKTFTPSSKSISLKPSSRTKTFNVGTKSKTFVTAKRG